MTVRYEEFAGKVAVVTGAARGMGAVFAENLAAQGVNVIAGDIDVERVTATAEEINTRIPGGGEVVPSRVDVAVKDDQTALADLALKRFGQLDYWVNNAGVFPEAGVLDIDAGQLDTTFKVNVNGMLFGAQAAAAAIGDRGGSVVNIASISAYRVRPSRATYSISKAAVDHLTRFLSLELGGTGLRVNAVAPGAIDTEMTRWVHEQPGAMEAMLMSIPLGRMGQPEDVMRGVLFLLSDEASYITGTTLVIDGGSRNHSV